MVDCDNNGANETQVTQVTHVPRAQRPQKHIIKIPTRDLTPEEKERKLNYFRKYNNTDRHRSMVNKYRIANIDKIRESQREYKRVTRERARQMLEIREVNDNIHVFDQADNAD